MHRCADPCLGGGFSHKLPPCHSHPRGKTSFQEDRQSETERGRAVGPLNLCVCVFASSLGLSKDRETGELGAKGICKGWSARKEAAPFPEEEVGRVPVLQAPHQDHSPQGGEKALSIVQLEEPPVPR